MTKSTKLFSGAPFGTQKTRFDISAVHPQLKLPGTFTEVPYCRIATARETRLRGPGTYNIETGSFTERAVRAKSSGPNWRKAFEGVQMSAIPHMLYREEWENKKRLSEQLGPGRYHTKDFIEDLETRPTSSRGACQTTGTRFQQENKFQASLPGPGTYGEGGIPPFKLEEKAKESFCKVGVMEGGCGRQENTQKEGSGLAPGVYEHIGSIQKLLNKKVGNRGPYDLYSGLRIPVNRQAQSKAHLAPGRYKISPFTEILHDKHHKKQGLFSRMEQYPMPPTERIYCSTLSQWPRDEKDPGPGYYNYFRSCLLSAPPSHYPFDSSASRFRKTSNKHIIQVGPGQYDVHRWDRAQHKNGNRSVFQSAASRLPSDACSTREKLLNEKLHPKHVHEQQNIVGTIPADSAFEGVRT